MQQNVSISTFLRTKDDMWFQTKINQKRYLYTHIYQKLVLSYHFEKQHGIRNLVKMYLLMSKRIESYSSRNTPQYCVSPTQSCAQIQLIKIIVGLRIQKKRLSILLFFLTLNRICNNDKNILVEKKNVMGWNGDLVHHIEKVKK